MNINKKNFIIFASLITRLHCIDIPQTFWFGFVHNTTYSLLQFIRPETHNLHSNFCLNYAIQYLTEVSTSRV